MYQLVYRECARIAALDPRSPDVPPQQKCIALRALLVRMQDDLERRPAIVGEEFSDKRTIIVYDRTS